MKTSLRGEPSLPERAVCRITRVEVAIDAAAAFAHTMKNIARPGVSTRRSVRSGGRSTGEVAGGGVAPVVSGRRIQPGATLPRPKSSSVVEEAWVPRPERARGAPDEAPREPHPVLNIAPPPRALRVGLYERAASARPRSRG